jgi:hypothetical protein
MSFHDLSRNHAFLEECGRKATSWGITVGWDASKSCQTKLMRISLVPRPFKRGLYEKVVALGPAFNILVDRISQDVDWLIAAHIGMLIVHNMMSRF